jgi:hypothetical protein
MLTQLWHWRVLSRTDESGGVNGVGLGEKTEYSEDLLFSYHQNTYSVKILHTLYHTHTIALLWHYHDADPTPPLYVTLAKQNKRALRASYVRTKSISESDSLQKKHYARLHPQFIFPRLHGLYSLKGPEDILYILHILDLYQKEPHTSLHTLELNTARIYMSHQRT